MTEAKNPLPTDANDSQPPRAAAIHLGRGVTDGAKSLTIGGGGTSESNVVYPGSFGENGRERAIANSGGDGHDGGMESRIAKLEAGMEHVQRNVGDLRVDYRDFRKAVDRDFRLTWGMVIAGFLGLAWLMAKGFHWLP
ncbi:MAG: hypothetical protein ABT940_01185 [Alphaproteobacteria bacterium]